MSDDFSPETLLLERDGNVLWVRLHRPEARNGINMEMCAELQQTFDDIDDDPEIRCAIVTGEGKTFCTGGDLMPSAGSSSGRTAVDRPPSQMDYRRAVRPFQELFRSYWRMETPVVSAVNGTIAGAGWMLADPPAHKWERISNEDLGRPGCTTYHVRPKAGLLGMLMGWWQVVVSGGCP